MWPTIRADDCVWEVRAVAAEQETPRRQAAEEVLEFRCKDGMRPPRRLAVAAGALESMDEAALLSAYRQARPIGADYYGRPGKRMTDAG